MPSALPLLSQHLHRDDDIQGRCPPGPVLTGPPFSVRIPASFPTFLEDLWSPDSVCCIPTSLQMPALQGARSKPRRRQGPPASTGTHSERQKPRFTVENTPVVCLRCFLQVQERSTPKERTLAAYGPGVNTVLPEAWRRLTSQCHHTLPQPRATLGAKHEVIRRAGCRSSGGSPRFLVADDHAEGGPDADPGAGKGAPTHHHWDGTAALGGAEIPPWATPNLRDHPQGTVLGLGFGGDAH